MIDVMELQLIHKKRKLFARVIQYSFFCSLFGMVCIMLFDLELDGNIIQESIGVAVIATFATTVLYYTFLAWFPIIDEHNEIGVLTLDHYELTRTIYNKQQIFKLENLEGLKVEIFGHHGQDISSMGKIHLADGTSNFITLELKDESSIKMEFMLENQRVLNTLNRYLDFYKTQTNVRIS